MRLSRYFHELHDGYLSEIDDLRSDSDGQDVLERRLRDKRREFDAICGLIDTDPLMLAPALHGAFRVAPGRVRPASPSRARPLRGAPSRPVRDRSGSARQRQSRQLWSLGNSLSIPGLGISARSPPRCRCR
ncbi:MAG TPA: hypothetical protein PKC20_00240 [Burkholderiaceae bacterium]|nr:hypothetical protein [Burkholderiaceae bacterium]